MPSISEHFAREIVYFGAQKIDRWPGGEYPGAIPISSGTSVLAGAKFLHREGYFLEYRWGSSLYDLVLALSYHGPAVIGLEWYEGMKRPNEHFRMRPTGQLVGRHCLLAVGVELQVNHEQDSPSRYLVHFQNSLGADWGLNGRAAMCGSDLAHMLVDAELCIPTGVADGS